MPAQASPSTPLPRIGSVSELQLAPDPSDKSDNN